MAAVLNQVVTSAGFDEDLHVRMGAHRLVGLKHVAAKSTPATRA